MLIAYLDWAFPRKYDNEDRGIVYSHLFQNRFQRTKPGREMIKLVVHDPPDDWVQLEVMRPRQGKGQRKEDNMWRIRGLFKFNYNSREPMQTPVLHANSVTDERVEPNAVFVNCSNRTCMDRDIRYTIDIEQVQVDKREAYVRVDNVGPFLVPLPNEAVERRYSNKLIGVVPLGTRIIRTHHARSNGKIITTEEFIIDPDTGRLEPVA